MGAKKKFVACAAAVAAGCCTVERPGYDTLEAFRRGVQTVTTNCAKKQFDEYRNAAKRTHRGERFWRARRRLGLAGGGFSRLRPDSRKTQE